IESEIFTSSVPPDLTHHQPPEYAGSGAAPRPGLRDPGFAPLRQDILVAGRQPPLRPHRHRPRQHHLLCPAPAAQAPAQQGDPLLQGAQPQALYDLALWKSVRVLNVTYIPQVSLRLIKEEDGRQPKEDDYVRLVCEIRANPSAMKVGWLFDDQPLSHNRSRTDIVSGNTLVFKRLTRRNRGRLQVLCRQRGREGIQSRACPEHQPRARVQGEPADHVRRVPERERDGALRGGSGAHRRHLQVGVQQHGAQALQPAARRQGGGEHGHLHARHPGRLRNPLLLGQQQHRAPAVLMLLHSHCTSMQNGQCQTPVKDAIAASSERPSASCSIYFSLKDCLLGITERESLGLNEDQELNAKKRGNR
ncbi:hemicentin-2, partial [Caerostris extrusa]